MAEQEHVSNPRRSSITSSKLLENVTMGDLEKQALAIVKSRAGEEGLEKQDENIGMHALFRPHLPPHLTASDPSSYSGTQRTAVTRRISGLARSLSNSFTSTRGTLKRSFSMSNQNAPKITAPAAEVPLTREQEKQFRQALHFRLLTILTTTKEPAAITGKLVTLYMSPDFPSSMFDELLSLRILESIAAIISPTQVSMNPLARQSGKPQDVSNVFKDARKEAEDQTDRLWFCLCRNRVGRGEKEPGPEVKTKILSLGIMAVMWPRGVMELGFKDHAWGRCERGKYKPSYFQHALVRLRPSN